jgi:hypothetical protein
MSQRNEDVVKIRAEIFRLALQSPSLEIMHWYIALDDCFENDEFSPSELSSIKWRCMVLSWQKQPINNLAWMIDALVKKEGYDLNKVETGLEKYQ